MLSDWRVKVQDLHPPPRRRRAAFRSPSACGALPRTIGPVRTGHITPIAPSKPGGISIRATGAPGLARKATLAQHCAAVPLGPRLRPPQPESRGTRNRADLHLNSAIVHQHRRTNYARKTPAKKNLPSRISCASEDCSACRSLQMKKAPTPSPTTTTNRFSRRTESPGSAELGP